MTLSLRQTICALCIGFALIFCFSANARIAKSTTETAARSAQKKAPKGLSSGKAKGLSRKIVKALVSDDFFALQPLARKVVLSKIRMTVPVSEVTENELTNFVLDECLSYTKLLVVNQDTLFSANDKLEYKLADYDAMSLAARKGLQMGADYVLVGHLDEMQMVSSGGKVKPEYGFVLRVYHIKSGKLILEKKLEDAKRRKVRMR